MTSVGAQHLATFGSMENIIHEKMQMIECLPADGIGFVNRDNAYIRTYSIQNTCRIVWFGMSEDADYRCCDIRYSEEGTSFTVIQEAVSPVSHKAFRKTQCREHHSAIAVAHTLGVSWEIMALAVEKLPWRRASAAGTESFCTLLDDAYNSNPEGARCALEVLKQMKHQRFIITPGFLELGEQQEEEQYKLGEEIADSVDTAVLVGAVQTKSIAAGLTDSGFPKERVHVCDSFSGGTGNRTKQHSCRTACCWKMICRMHSTTSSPTHMNTF